MGLSNSLYASISGLSTMGNAMSVLGDNVANVNTIAFKSSRATFQDVLSQSIATAAGSAQIGRGVTLSTIDGLFAQGSFESTSTATDLAIGGDGFFMLRAAGSAQADMYTRAGEFRFNTEGYLINPSGAFVQGWTINPTSGEIQGTIGDINLGKSTPPVASTKVDVIVNVDSRQNNEVTEARLYDAWDGRNAAAAVPSDPIASTAYNYTSAIKVYDSKGAAHDVSIYFDRTTKDNQWEFLVTCPPLEDHRNLTTGVDASGNLNGTNDELTIYAPDTTYNAAKDKGAGALLYGTIDFSVSGEISKISAWRVPPDGKVDPASDVNRITLGSTDQYYTFDTNFTGAATNQAIALNLGATYTGQTTALPQILVSDKGASSTAGGTTPITKETLWSSVFDSAGAQMANGDVFTFSGYDHGGNAVSGSYTVNTAEKVQSLLDQLDTTFSCTATIDAQGRIVMTDKTGGPSGMYVTNFTTTSANSANPFGSEINITTSKQEVVSPGRGITNLGPPVSVINATTDWGNVLNSAGAGPLANGNTFTFAGTRGDGSAVNATFTVGTDYGPPLTAPSGKVNDLLFWLENQFNAEASIDGDGRLVLTDRTANEPNGYTSQLSVTSVANTGAATNLFGPPATTFATIPSDLTGEDGSMQGETTSTDFNTEALSSTQYANSSTTIFQNQNGFAAGFLQSVSVDTTGVITGNYSNGQVLKKAQVALASFNNVQGLRKEGGNIFRETTDSGAPVTGAPGTNGLGSISPNSLEQSNVDLGTEFVKLITTQRGFQANSKVITTTDDMLSDLINIKR